MLFDRGEAERSEVLVHVDVRNGLHQRTEYYLCVVLEVYLEIQNNVVFNIITIIYHKINLFLFRKKGVLIHMKHTVK